MKPHTVIIANGDFPRKGGEARRVLEQASRIVACDGAADALKRHLGRTADFVVGDMDSSKMPRRTAGEKRVIIPEQQTNDLSKAIRFCLERGWQDLVIVGATGKREDHSLGNIFRVMEAGLVMITDHGRFVPFTDRIRFRTRPGAAVSVFAADPKTMMNSKGLEWPLDGVRFRNLYCATLNRASSAIVEITSTCPAFVYFAEDERRPTGERRGASRA